MSFFFFKFKATVASGQPTGRKYLQTYSLIGLFLFLNRPIPWQSSEKNGLCAFGWNTPVYTALPLSMTHLALAHSCDLPDP